MSKSGVACYRNGGCGPYEMYSCSECPASKSDYMQFKRKPITNYDRIISKTPEELAEWIDHIQADAYERGLMENPVVDYPNIYSGWLDWLKQEAE